MKISAFVSVLFCLLLIAKSVDKLKKDNYKQKEKIILLENRLNNNDTMFQRIVSSLIKQSDNAQMNTKIDSVQTENLKVIYKIIEKQIEK